MHVFELPYGDSTIKLTLPDKGFIGEFYPRRQSTTDVGDVLIERALDNPIGTRRLEELVRPGQKVVIVTSDLTRPCPSDVLLPHILDRLNSAGVSDEYITIVIALGLHRKMSVEELQKAVGKEVYQRVRVLNHDVDDTVHVGTTGRGTEVEIFRPVAEADFRICLGNVEFHYFAGFSGGAKAILPGVASARTIRQNHSHMMENGAEAAHIYDNPVRMDIEEGVSFVGIDFILNVVVDEHHRVIDAVAGDWIKAHRVLSERLEKTGTVAVEEALDIAIVSAGGHPKDINLYQAQKAIDNCAGVLKPGGRMILLARCPEKFGSETFRKWMTSGKRPAELVEDLKRNFVLGGHKAAAISKVVLKTSEIFLVTNEEFAGEKLVGIECFSDPVEAIEAAFSEKGADAKYAVFPLGASTLPRIK
ncbi:nickel-dependent lactate racemase [Kosmotoga pacifica]|uniref:Uncharacterized protein n=1 Tax=Kosmotoga pacifica TaxID=1330330 RepID=A0A0G2Z743_9BACT|nr:nickel-dependent lactate racemase [Kosmotoga pacifica]AKI97425.1 hypothetical protein IX53_05900 [Kosmotoga pacifica]